MAMVDYGAVYKKNGAQLNKDLFMNMRESVGFTLGGLQGIHNRTERVEGNWFVYMGDQELLVCAYKTQLLFISNGKIVEHLYGLEDDKLRYTKYRKKFILNGVHFDIKRINDKPQFYLRFWYKNEMYECIYGYDIDVEYKY